MSIKLLDKPFYFITDRQTDYLYFINNNNKSKPQKILYYPKQFEKMNTKQLLSFKKSLPLKFLFWAVFHPKKLAPADQLICYSKIIDITSILILSMFLAKHFRKLLFRIQLPILETGMQNLGMNIRVSKALFAYSVVGFITYNFLNKNINEQYLIDLGFQYHRNFIGKLQCPQCDQIFDELNKKRFDLQV